MKHDEPEQAMARNREKGERPRTPRTARCTGRLVLVGMICVWMTVGCAPKGKIASDSKTEACRAELAGALQTLSSDYGLAYSVDPTDADSIFSTGVVKKSYGRDGIVHGCFFGLDVTANGCALKFFKKTTSEPGHWTSSSGDYGSLQLKQCRCAK